VNFWFPVMNACSNKPKVLRWLPENNPSQKTEDGGSKPVGTEQLNAFLQLFTHGWWRGGPYRPADVNTLIIINKHKALKIMDQSDGYASLMLEKKKTTRKRKTREILNLRGRQEMTLWLCCTKFYNEKSNFDEHSNESWADSSSEGAVEIQANMKSYSLAVLRWVTNSLYFSVKKKYEKT